MLVLVILFVFLDARVAFWGGGGHSGRIPRRRSPSMWGSDQSINMISMFALIMMLGIIVDDAIVVGEHTATCQAQGYSRLEAAERGATRMLAPVIAATLTTMAAFFPIFLVRDQIGDVMARDSARRHRRSRCQRHRMFSHPSGPSAARFRQDKPHEKPLPRRLRRPARQLPRRLLPRLYQTYIRVASHHGRGRVGAPYAGFRAGGGGARGLQLFPGARAREYKRLRHLRAGDAAGRAAVGARGHRKCAARGRNAGQRR